MNKLNRIWILFVSIIMIMMIFTAPAAAAPQISSQYYCLVDTDSGQIILSKGASVARPMASTTKIMTAILALEYSRSDEIAIVSAHADHTPEYTIGLKTGQKIAVAELLKVALIRSANDAAVVLAEHVAGDESFFAHLMSVKAFTIGAMQTRFKNASGLPAAVHISTAYDLAVMGQYALSNHYFKDLVSTRKTDFQHPSYNNPLTITNTNRLLGSYPGVDGVKTGTTDAAGKCLVVSASLNGRRLIAVVLKAADREGDCVRLLNYGFKETKLTKIIDCSQPFKDLSIEGGEKSFVEVYPQEDITIWQGNNPPEIQKKVQMNYDITAPVVKGQKLGNLEIYTEGYLFKTIDLIAAQTVNKQPGILTRLSKEFFSLRRE